MDERLRFVARLLDGEKMAALCREFDVSRKTGYKIFQRYIKSTMASAMAVMSAPMLIVLATRRSPTSA
jgi:transposase-like protein